MIFVFLNDYEASKCFPHQESAQILASVRTNPAINRSKFKKANIWQYGNQAIFIIKRACYVCILDCFMGLFNFKNWKREGDYFCLWGNLQCLFLSLNVVAYFAVYFLACLVSWLSVPNRVVNSDLLYH